MVLKTDTAIPARDELTSAVRAATPGGFDFTRRLGFSLALSASLMAACASDRAVHPPGIQQAEIGDVVFFRSTTWRGRLVRLIDWGPSDFSHVGIVAGESEQRVLIVHAAPPGFGRDGRVRVESLNDILGRGEMVEVAFYAPSASTVERVRSVHVALAYAVRHAPFDDEFEWDEDSSVYCTELIWLAFRQAGMPRPKAPWIVYPSDLLKTGYFRFSRLYLVE